MKGKGKLSIARMGQEAFRLELEDQESGVMFLQVDIDPTSLMLALAGVGSKSCEFNLFKADLIGKKQETKVEYLEGISLDSFMESFSKAVAPLEVDGWKADKPMNGFNGHDYKNGKYKVVFRRFVNVEE